MPTTSHPLLSATMKRLEALGSEATRKTWLRHGAGENCYGVKFGDLAKLTKEVKREIPDERSRHALAVALWHTGNADAQAFAAEIAVPALLDPKGLEGWVDGMKFKMLVDIFGALVGRSPLGETMIAPFIASKTEQIACAGWVLVAMRAQYSGIAEAGCRGGWGSPPLDPAKDEAESRRLIAEIKKRIHGERNRVRHSMYMALIAIGIKGGKYHDLAVAAAKRIGKVEVDHGDTACQTPDAIPYMDRALARKAGKAPKPARSSANKRGAAKSASAKQPAPKKPSSKKPAGSRSKPARKK